MRPAAAAGAAAAAVPSREHVMPTALAAAHVRMARAHGALGVAAPLPPADPGVRPAGPSRGQYIVTGANI